jgi:signal transduction histidine kinase
VRPRRQGPWRTKPPFHLPLFVKYLLVLIPVFLSLSYIGLELFVRFDLRDKEEELAVRIGHQAARAAAALARHPTAADTGLANDLLAPLAFDRAVACVEWRTAIDGRILVTFPPTLGCTGQNKSQRLSLDVGDDAKTTLDIFFTDAEVVRTARLRQNFVLLALGIAFLITVVSGSLGFRLIVGRPLGRLHAAIRQTAELSGPTTVSGGSTDELGEVIAAFNDMIVRETQIRQMLVQSNQDLRTSERALQKLTFELDARVRARTEELSAEKARAEAANQAKSDFLANMSHELRTPLHGILSFAALGLERVTTAKPERLGHYFSQIQASGEVLLVLLNDLLDLAKFEAGKMSFDFQLGDLRSVLATINDEFQSLLSERSLRLYYEPPPIPIWVSVDTQRFTQVLRNLLSNAIKFSSVGGALTLCLSRHENTVRVTVQDQGPGIPPLRVKLSF